MSLTTAFDETMLRRYRELLDSEDAAFDELEHAYEEGDRDHFVEELDEWASIARRRMAFLKKLDLAVEDGRAMAEVLAAL